MSLHQSQGQGRALLLLSLQAEVSFLLAACCTHTRNVPGCVHACTCPAGNKISCRRDVLPVHPGMDRREKEPQNLLILNCCRCGTSHGPNSHVQMQKQLLYPGFILLPFIPSMAPPNSTSQHPCSGCSWLQAGVTMVAPHNPMPQCHS